MKTSQFGFSEGMSGQETAEERPHLVMLGNSMQGCGIDFPALSRAIGRAVESKTSGGIMSAHKFAMLWHAVRAAQKPPMAIIVFRRNNITNPTLRVTGDYGKKLQEALTDPELRTIVERLAYPRQATPAPDCREGGQADATRNTEFAGLVPNSFLPEMIRVAKEAGVRLVLVRCKSRLDAEQPGHELPAMKEYTLDLARYLQEHDVHFLDYVHEPGIGVDCYANGDHLNEKGKRIWTRLMAEDLAALLAGTRAPPRTTVS